ncbi:MAG: dihydroorotate dehydrogenase-like protein, partial [Candidatus Marinimicrobia bacterium]|nr:dihydroorotate dehydrogenase-like protein [Candidatus Neomarinimicrobiota bacterium]
SALLKLGPEHVITILDEMESWMDEHEYESVEQMKGSMSMKNVSDSEAFMRSNYMKALNKYK